MLVVILVLLSLYGCSESKVNISSACSMYSSCDNEDENIASNSIKSINYSDYKSHFQDGRKFMVLIGRDDCQWCAKIIDVINEMSLTQGYSINYLNIANLSDDELTDFFETLESLWNFDDELGIPLIIKYENKKIIDYLIGFPNYSNVDNDLQSLWIKNSLKIIMEE